MLYTSIMHSFLIVGNSQDELKAKADKLAQKLNAKILEFPLAKIDDVRSLNSLIRLSFDEPTLIFSENINDATEEALNAFLKNLEEPQDNIYFALTSPSTRKVLPTIVSRCEVIKSTNNPITQSTNKLAEEFLNFPVGEKLAYTDKIKDRGEAVEFVENLIDLTHQELHGEPADYSKLAKNLEVESQTLGSLRANGNVSLQLANMVISLE